MKDPINSEDFIKAWMTSTTLEQVATKTGFTKLRASVRANLYRKRGIDLPKFAGGTRPKLNVERLNAIINAYADKVHQ